MTISPQKFREVVFQILYGLDSGNTSEKQLLDLLMKEVALSKKNVQLALDRVKNILGKLPEIDTLITNVSRSYDFKRIQSVERNILRLGVFELYFDEGFPPKVAIAEAIRLSRKFSSPASATFINAVLDNLYQIKIGNKVNETDIENSFKEFSAEFERIEEIKKMNAPEISENE